VDATVHFDIIVTMTKTSKFKRTLSLKTILKLTSAKEEFQSVRILMLRHSEKESLAGPQISPSAKLLTSSTTSPH
jgi:hypothetical protein